MAKTADLAGIEGEGVAPKSIARLDKAIGKWRGIVSERMSMTEKEADAKKVVNQIMHEENVSLYLYTDDGDVEKECVIVDSVKLRRRKTEKDEDDD